MSASQLPIRVRELCKVYKVYDKPLDMVLELVSGRSRHRDFWALKDISFEVKRGEVVGVVGRNGAGKSTLLKILAGTLDRTSGSVAVDGKVSAILELGTGFHGEYTGLENIYMGGLCLGMSREEVDDKLESVVKFSELQDFIEQPFKTYSSGMKARLTFSVAISVDPDILIVDEALAAGDALFSEKCSRRIRQIVQGGATVFFCTHSIPTIVELCDTAILLSKGELLLHDRPREVSYAYDELLAVDRQAHLKNVRRPVVSVQNSPGMNASVTGAEPAGGGTGADAALDSEPAPVDPQGGSARPESGGTGQAGQQHEMKAELLTLTILNEQGTEVQCLEHGRVYTVRAVLACYEDVDDLGVGFRIETPNGTVVYGLQTAVTQQTFAVRRGDVRHVDFSVPCRLQAGTYVLGGGIAEMMGETNYTIIHILRGACVFNVTGRTKFAGVADLEGQFAGMSLQTPDLAPHSATEGADTQAI